VPTTTGSRHARAPAAADADGGPPGKRPARGGRPLSSRAADGLPDDADDAFHARLDVLAVVLGVYEAASTSGRGRPRMTCCWQAPWVRMLSKGIKAGGQALRLAVLALLEQPRGPWPPPATSRLKRSAKVIHLAGSPLKCMRGAPESRPARARPEFT